ncbi:Mut7-C RNAse domain-containing protein [Pontibacter rugosus]|uniref:Mut7-C RNAse domain-containing protein n=2 Tax=Pontibacter rugosus TaxID=1745966 RepID=A0ABW3SRJ9_9BACT
MNTASFRFHGALQDFLKKRERDQTISYTFKGAPAVKDAIEAMGVPHPEVDVILLNKKPATLQQAISAGDEVDVFPVDAKYNWPVGYSFSKNHPAPKRFILDVHLGTLAKSMRMLGVKTYYQTDLSDNTIAQLAQEQQLVVLTRDIGLLKQKVITWGYWLRSQHTQEQLEEVIRRFDLWDSFSPFRLCLECNTPVLAVDKECIMEQLPPKTRLYFNEFYQCPSCKRVYWKGSHYDRMQGFIAQLIKNRNG